MLKKFTLFIGSVIIILVLAISYLSLFGYETEKFNKIIVEKVKNKFPSINLKLKKVKIITKPLSLSINVETKNSEIEVKGRTLIIKKISTNYNIISFFKKDFGIKNFNFETKNNEINNVLKFARSFQDSPQLLILDKISKTGKFYVKGSINLSEKGKIKNDYVVSGEVKNLSLDFFNKEKINNLNFNFSYRKDKINLSSINFEYLSLLISSEKINLIKKNNIYLVQGDITNKNSKIESKIIKKFFNNENFKNLTLSSNSEFSFILDKKFKFKNLKLKSSLFLENAEYYFEANKLKKILPNFDNKFIIKNNKINLEYDKNLNISGSGEFYGSEDKESINYDIKRLKDNLNIKIGLSLNNTPIKFSLLEFHKDKSTEGKLSLNFNKYKKKLSIENFSLISKKNEFALNELILSENFKIIDVKKIKLFYKDQNNIANNMILNKKKNFFQIEGNHFSLSSIIKNILTEDSRGDQRLFDQQKRTFKIKFDENYIDDDHIIYGLSGDMIINDNKIVKLNLKSKFADDKKILLTINNNDGSQVTTFYSDLAKPFVKKFKFIKGFEEGKINFSSTKFQKRSSSQLNIYDFKLKELPALTKLLTLASLQGISDILKGEGVRFNEFEMIFSNDDNLMKIEEIYSIGPALSIMMDGYVQKDELISLKGTLVPATTINKFVSSIPLLGDILVGKKTGEGVFGVSFKIKGEPKNLKTTVNPIKTLTPRFITRTLEKIKKAN